MARPISLLIVFFLTLNLFSGVLITTGVAETMGLGGQVEIGGDEASEDVQNETENVSTGAPTGSTLFGMYNVLAGTLSTIRKIAFAGPIMLNNAGVPGAITGMFEIIIGVIYSLGLISFLRGFGL